MSSTVDLRSDTVTLPPEMRQAIARAPLGDDVYGDDPTVNALEALVADILRKEDAILTPSGTMANVIALMAHCSSRKRILLGDLSDICDAQSPQTNMVFWTLTDPELNVTSFVRALKDESVHIAELTKGRLRAVTHYRISARDIECTAQEAERALANLPSARWIARKEGANDLTAVSDVQPRGTLLLRSIH
jgi:threonine aldolase